MDLSRQEWASLAETAVRPGAPAGESIAYDPEFEAIKTEIAKIDSLTGEVPNWGEMVEHSANLLRSRAKDLTVASYLTLALFRQQGYAGLSAGLAVCRTLLATYWEDLFPEKKRLRGRAAALAWLNERVAAAVSRATPEGSEIDAVKACAEDLAGLDALVAEKFGDEAPSMGDLRRNLQEAEQACAAPPPPPAPSPTGPPAAAAGPAPVDSVDAALRVLRSAAAEVRRAVEFLVKNDPASPVSYLATRGLAWSMIRELPQEKDGITMLSAPDPAAVQAWERMESQGQWTALLEDTEWRVVTNPLWLDLNYFVAAALRGLGHETARRAVADQCSGLLRRLPRLTELKYQDGTPFLSGAAHAWIEQEVQVQGADGAQASERKETAQGPLAELSRQARDLARRGRLSDAVHLIQEGTAGCATPRERFRYRLELAGICLEAGSAGVAVALLEALDQEIEQHGLEEWEPELSLAVLRLLYQAEKKLSQKGQRDARDSVLRMDRLYARLCRLDLKAALALEGKR